MQRLLSFVDNNILELHAMALEKMMEFERIKLINIQDELKT